MTDKKGMLDNNNNLWIRLDWEQQDEVVRLTLLDNYHKFKNGEYKEDDPNLTESLKAVLQYFTSRKDWKSLGIE